MDNLQTVKELFNDEAQVILDKNFEVNRNLKYRID